MEEKRRDKTRVMRLVELELNLKDGIEEYIARRTQEGSSISEIAHDMKITPQCLRDWIRQFGGVSRIEFPRRETAEAAR